MLYFKDVILIVFFKDVFFFENVYLWLKRDKLLFVCFEEFVL